VKDEGRNERVTHLSTCKEKKGKIKAIERRGERGWVGGPLFLLLNSATKNVKIRAKTEGVNIRSSREGTKKHSSKKEERKETLGTGKS